MDCQYCIDGLAFAAKILDIETKCKYHKKKGEVYSVSSFVPKGLCMELFYAAYPSSLAVLYNGTPARLGFRKNGLRRAVVSCPHPKGIKVEISCNELFLGPLRMIKEFIEELLKIVYRPLDMHFRRVTIKVIEVSAYCPKGYKVGDRFEFNTHRRNELCPAGFAAIYPYLRVLGKEGNANSLTAHCPDYVGVTYEIRAGS